MKKSKTEKEITVRKILQKEFFNHGFDIPKHGANDEFRALKIFEGKDDLGPLSLSVWLTVIETGYVGFYIHLSSLNNEKEIDRGFALGLHEAIHLAQRIKCLYKK